MTSLDTIRWRIVLGLSGLLAGLIIASVVGVTSLATLRRSLGGEIARLRESSEVGNGFVTAVFDEIRAAEQYLGERGQQTNDQFQAVIRGRGNIRDDQVGPEKDRAVITSDAILSNRHFISAFEESKTN